MVSIFSFLRGASTGSRQSRSLHQPASEFWKLIGLLVHYVSRSSIYQTGISDHVLAATRYDINAPYVRVNL